MSGRAWSRRKFLSGAMTGLGAAGLVAAGGGSEASGSPQAGAGRPGPAPAGEILTRVLGRTGLRVPVVNFGVMNADNPGLVRRAYELGMRLYDTAAYYMRGQNEAMVGSVLQEMGVRDEVVIATKVFLPHAQRGIPASGVRDFYLKTAEDSLRRLKTDHIDILHSHNVDNVEYLNHPGILEALELLKKQGKTRFIGFSTHMGMAACLDDAARSGVYDVILTTFNYSFHDYAELGRAVEKAAGAGIGLMAMKTQCNTDWYERELPPQLREHFRPPLMHSALLKWALGHESFTCAVPGVTTFRQMEENAACLRDLEFTADERKFLEDRRVKLAMGTVCRRCGTCIGTCPRGVHIPDLLRAEMYAFHYGNLIQARQTLDEVGAARGIGACGDCGACVAVCANRVDIGRRLARLKDAFA